MKLNFKFLWPHLLAVLCFVVLTMVYFKPIVFDGKVLPQSDTISAIGMAKDAADHQKETGEYCGWTEGMFGGMPSSTVIGIPAFNVFHEMNQAGRLGFDYFSAGILLLSLLMVYISLLCLGCSAPLSVLGAVATAFVSYNFIIMQVGHVTKMYAIANMIPAIVGLYLLFKEEKPWKGALLLLFGTGMLIASSHVQIDYYTMLILACIWLVYGIYAVLNKTVITFLKRTALVVAIGILAILPTSVTLFPSYEYGKDTMRGGHVLEQKEDEAPANNGLDIDYAFSWSQGIAESYTLLVPNFYGGSSHETLNDKAPLKQRYGVPQAPTYWGDQPFTSGPVYAGALICFLFVLGLFVVKGPEKWWILAGVVLGLILSWGRNLMFINEFLFYHLPFYSKFRTPAMALVIVTTLMALFAVITLKQIISDPTPERYKKPLWYSAGITGGLCLIFAVLGPSLFSFTTPNDAALSGQWPADAMESLRQTRIALLKADAWRSFLLVAIGACLLFCYIGKKLKATPVLIALAVVTLLDLWTIDRRYLNETHFQKKQESEVLPSDIDLAIRQDPDPHYRVFNAAGNTFNESMTSYFHKSIGGYSPVKLRRYQDLIDYHLSRQLNVRVLNMLNTKYFIIPNKAGGGVQLNEAALGNAWFVNDLQWVKTNNEEIEALYTFDPAHTAVVHEEFRTLLAKNDATGGATMTADTTAVGSTNDATSGATVATATRDTKTITDSASATSSFVRLTTYKPNYLAYQSDNPKGGVVVFSEIYYPKEWTAYIDGVEVPHFRVNYVLRGLWIPQGKHQIEFKHQTQHYALWRSVSNGGSILAILVAAGLAAWMFYQNRKGSGQAPQPTAPRQGKSQAAKPAKTTVA